MEVKTVGGFIEKLKTLQQELIVVCVQTYGGKPDFHRGLLPFLTAQDAVNCLRMKLVDVVRGTSQDDSGPSKLGIRYVRHLISIFEEALPHAVCEDEASVEMFLRESELVAEFGSRVQKRFHLTQGSLPNFLPRTAGLIQLDWLGKDRWKVTTHKAGLPHATTWLAENFR